VFSGGGLAGLSYLGVIRYMQENDFIKDIHEVSGTSIGAFFACLFAMNIMPDELETYLKEFFKKDENITFPLLTSLITIMDTYGIDNGEKMILPIKYFIKKKYEWDKETITIREFVKKTGINIVICAVNVNKRKVVYFSVDTTPDVCLYDAIQASMSVPMMMRPVMINEDFYVDGGICDNCPISGFRKSGRNNVLIMELPAILPEKMEINDFFSFLSIVVQTMITNTSNPEKLKYLCSSYDILKLNETPIPFLPIETCKDGTIKIKITDDDIDQAIGYGYTKMYELVKEKEREKEL
jgi:NTE family protein